MRETAYAKINLALHVRGRRHDGYHDIETLFAFVDAGDVLAAHVGDNDTLHVLGPFAQALGVPFDNLAALALNALPRSSGLEISLEKILPVSAGLGGGSADAGAVFRIVREMYGLPENWREKAAKLGADVPACVDSVAAIGRGTGTDIEPVENDLAGTEVLLVNPGEALATGPVFEAWDGEDRGGLPTGSCDNIAREGRNDLESPAISLCPPVADVLAALRETGAFVTRMSGSGATCFALYRSAERADAAVSKIAKSQPDWWHMRGRLR
ncbi:MAG: 4-(cytidine 5'-diphospho)-2-C-methyl-D-erythritol kinase [Parerythrobacter sp.]